MQLFNDNDTTTKKAPVQKSYFVLKGGETVQVEKPSTINEVEVNYKTKVKLDHLPARGKITLPELGVDILRAIWSDRIEFLEEMYILMLNRANVVTSYARISQGSTVGTIFCPKLIFQNALLCNAQALILAHNHPSGNITPSASDKAITKKVIEAGKIMEINVLDHLILTPDNYYSFAENGEI